jgi:RimJ/RimL family protein N-acetyltransferase
MFGIVAEAEGQLDSVGEFVGVCGLTSINMSHRTAEFSLYCALEYQGKGYAKKALKTLLNYGFNELGLQNIWGEVLDGNRAMNMFLEIGFKHEATLRKMYFKSGKFLSCHRISMLAEEFSLNG